MKIIADSETKNNLNELKGFWLHFYLNGEGGEFLDYDLPFPTYLEHYNRGYAVAWCIEGYFGTKDGENFLNDVIARFLLSFADLSPKRLPYKPNYEKDNKTAHILVKAYSLKSFSRKLKNLPTKKKFTPRRADSFEDFIFWAIKLYAEDLIRDYGIIPYEMLEDFALRTFEHKKDRSTLKAKSKSIWEYYEKRDWELPKKKFKQTKGEYKMTRIENMKKINEERAEEKRKKILNAISGMFADDLKKKNGSWHIGKISKDLNIARDTVKKYLKEYEDDLFKKFLSYFKEYDKEIDIDNFAEDAAKVFDKVSKEKNIPKLFSGFFTDEDIKDKRVLYKVIEIYFQERYNNIPFK